MLTEVKAYSTWQSAPQLLLDDNGRAETDLIQVRNIQGLDPVIASIGTAPFGSVDGEAFVGTSVKSRNIVLTLHPNPDWGVWTFEALRRLLYSYFMPKQEVRLVFYSDDMPTMDIRGIVETVAANPFSEDPEFLVSIICPDPYFYATTPVILTGGAIRAGGSVLDIEYNGSVEAGVQVKLEKVSGTDPNSIGIQIGDPNLSWFTVNVGVDSDTYFQMSSFPRSKYAKTVTAAKDKSVLANVVEGSEWPMLLPGTNEFSVITNVGVQNWELTYFERFGGL